MGKHGANHISGRVQAAEQRRRPHGGIDDAFAYGWTKGSRFRTGPAQNRAPSDLCDAVRNIRTAGAGPAAELARPIWLITRQTCALP